MLSCLSHTLGLGFPSATWRSTRQMRPAHESASKMMPGATTQLPFSPRIAEESEEQTRDELPGQASSRSNRDDRGRILSMYIYQKQKCRRPRVQLPQCPWQDGRM